MKRMLVLCPFPENCAAQQRLKYEQYFDDWRRAGWQIDVSPFLDRNAWDVLYEPGHLFAKVVGTLKGYLRRLRDFRRIADYDLVYVCMWASPFGGPLFERLVRRRAKAMVYDIEDNVFESAEDQTGHPNPLSRLLKRQSKFLYLIKHADHVIVASPLLLEPYRQLNRTGSVSLISPSLDTDRICPLAVTRDNDDPPVIGWTGTFSSRIYLDQISGMLQRLAQTKRFKLRIIGNFDYTLDGVDLDVVRWSAEREAEDLQSLDIGIYPLPDDQWTRGKAGLKIIQYQAAGIPCVASDVPLSRQQIDDGETGFLVNSDAEWIACLSRLLGDKDLRRRVGVAGREQALSRYSHEIIAQSYRVVLSSVAQGKSA